MPIRRVIERTCLLPMLAWATMLCVAASLHAAPAWHDSVDYTKLQNRLGAATPTGAGVPISLVEAISGGSYLVDTSSPEFNGSGDPLGIPTTVTNQSGVAATGFSNHATNTVGRHFFGNSFSISPGANNVDLYEAGHWLGSIIHSGNTSPPASQPYRVQNYSWVSNSSGSQEMAAVRRLDYLVETSEMTAVAGANNAGLATLVAHPTLFAHSYNAIVVGRTDGAHSRGQTTAYGAGRYRPDIVAPSTATSTSSAIVSSAATLLHSSATGPDGGRSEVIKATLLAGATKTEFANWVDGTTGTLNPWNRTAVRPLDDVFGAGELNIYNSYLAQLGGKQAASASAPAAPVGSYGWDYQDRKADSAVGDLFYNFVVPTGSTASELSIILSWNAKITDTNAAPAVFIPQESLQNLDLQFFNSTTEFMGTLLDQSISTVDNVEHIYMPTLGPGTYTLKVSGAANWDYGLAWRMTTAFDQPTADFDGDGIISGGDFLVWQRNFGTLLGATNSTGDADGDGDVDADDLALWKAGAIAPAVPPMVASLVAAVPEPAAAGMCGVAVMALMGFRQLRRRHG